MFDDNNNNYEDFLNDLDRAEGDTGGSGICALVSVALLFLLLFTAMLLASGCRGARW